MATVQGSQVKLNNGQVVTPQQGGWYDGQQYWNGSLSSAGQINSQSNQQGAGQQVSSVVVAQTNPTNVDYLKASDIQPPVNLSLPSSQSSAQTNSAMTTGIQAAADAARKNLDTTLAAQKAQTDKQLAEARAKEQSTLGSIEQLSTPFRADLQTAQNESLYVNKNFEENQKLVDELDSLLTQGNDLIKQQQSVTGLAAIRNPRVQQTMNDIAARAGVIQAVMSARNSQIAQAQNLIDRNINAIAADRQDQINYYTTVLNLNNRDILSLDAESRELANQQLQLLKDDATRAQDTADYVKKLLIDPATATLMGQAGVTLNDSVAQINQKITQAQYAQEVADMSNKIELAGGKAVLSPQGVPADRLVTLTDSRGVKHYYEANPGTLGTPSAKTGGGISAQDKLEQRATDLQKAQQFIKDNPNATAAELELGIRQYTTQLSESDIKSILATKKTTYTPGQLQQIALGLIDEYSKNFGQTEKGKEAAISEVNANPDLSPQEKQQIIQTIEQQFPINFFEKASNYITNLFK